MQIIGYTLGVGECGECGVSEALDADFCLSLSLYHLGLCLHRLKRNSWSVKTQTTVKELNELVMNEDYFWSVLKDYENIYRLLDTGSASENARRD